MTRSVFATALLLVWAAQARVVMINEIANKGSSDVCNGEDWIELYNAGSDPVDLGAQNYVLHDNKGAHTTEAFVFQVGSVLAGQDYLLLCTKQTLGTGTSGTADPMSPQFGISGDDTITLTRIQMPGNGSLTFGSSASRAADGGIYEVVSVVTLPNTNDAFDVSYAFDFSTELYNFTSTPTPGAPNVFTKLLTMEEKNAKLKAKLKVQNDEGTQFFNMDDRGYPVEGGMDDVLDLNFTILEADYAYLVQNKTFEMYRPFQSAVLSKTDGTKILALTQPGKIRAKGQSSLFLATCMDAETFPFQVEMGERETIFGIERIYLRHHIGDYSYMRDWAYNRMLARFGLPFLRARKVRVYINGHLHGFYTLLEAPDQDYVFARSFPDFDPEAYALYKVKSAAWDCGSYTHEEIAVAEQRLDETSTPPYAFQRGEHKTPVEVLGLFESEQCIANYNKQLWEDDYYDVVLAWLRYDRSCKDMLLEEGLIEQDLGSKSYKKEMEQFITEDYSMEEKCNEQCANTDLKYRVDTDNWLKTFAFYAVTMNSDTPLVNGNNFYMAMTGADNYGGTGGWKLVAFDFNLPNVVYCHDDLCNSRIVHWSIARPTCTSLEQNNLVGPLLLDEDLHNQYLEYVRDFVEEVFGNQSFVEELERHAAAQKEYVIPDFWSLYGAFYDKELTPEGTNWQEEEARFPLLPTMKARADDVRAQLASIDAGTYPRGPFVGVYGDYEPWEPCVDWRLAEPNQTACAGGCEYHGCHEPSWTVASYCEEETGRCLHGDYDAKCHGIYDNHQYLGMEADTFCRYTQGVPVKVRVCPAVGSIPALASTSGSAGHTFALPIIGSVVFGMVTFMFCI